MDISFVEEPSANIKNPFLVPKSNHSPIASRSIELVVADDEREASVCEHFSIRGYVAEVRKRDTKICWPFHMLRNHSSDEHANSLPPLSVTKFRWWGCQNCLYKTIAPEAVKANGGAKNIHADEVRNDKSPLLGNAIVASHTDATKSVSSFPRLSEEKILKERLNEEDSNINGRNGEWHPSICCGKRETKEGFKISVGGQEVSEEDENHLSKTIGVATEGEACQTGERGEGNIGVSANNSEFALLGEESPNIMSSKQKGTEVTELMNGFGVAEMSDEMITPMRNTVAAYVVKNDQGLSKMGKMMETANYVAEVFGMMPLGVDVGIPKVDALTAISANMSDRDYMCLDKGSHEEASDGKIHLNGNMVQNQDDAWHPAVSVENCHHRKARKVRLLDDIIRNEVLQKTEKIRLLNGDAKGSGNDADKRPDASKEKARHLGHKSHIATKNTEVKLTKTKKRSENAKNDDEGPSLMHWLKKIPKQTISRKGDAEPETINTAAGPSKFVACPSAVKIPDLNLEVHGERVHKQESIVDKKKNQVPQVKALHPSVIPQQHNVTWKGHTIPNDLPTKCSHSKSTRAVITEKSLHQGIETQDSTHKMVLLSYKKNKSLQVEDGESSQINWLKDSFGIQKQAGYQVQEKVTKKQRTMRACEKDSLDDIPMDIVELLARRLMNTKVDSENMQNSLEMTENIKDVNSWDVMDRHGKKVSDAVRRNLPQEKSHSNIKGYSVCTTVKSNGSADGRPTAYHSSSNGKQNRNIDLNQQAPISASTDSQSFAGYFGLATNGSQLSVIEPDRECPTQNFWWNGMTMLALGSHQMDQTASCQNSCRNVHDGSLLLLNDTPSGSNGRKVDVDFNDLNKGSNPLFLRENLKTVAHEASYWKPINSSDKDHLNGKDKAESSTNGGTPASTSYVEAGNGYPSNLMGPVDLHTHETISAMNLLRLMDRAACSGEPCHAPMGNDRIGPTQESVLYRNCQSNELPVSEVRRRTREARKHPLNPDRDHQHSCKPLRPLPRVGVLGAFFQKEIGNNLNNSRTTFGFGTKHSNELTSLNFNGKENGEASHSAICTSVLNAQTSISRDRNSKWIASSVGSHSHPRCSPARDGNGQVGAVQPLGSSSKVEVCVVNRNPADFTIPVEDNEYMIGNEEPRPPCMPTSECLQQPSQRDCQKRQKVMKLNDLKGSLRC